VTKEPKVENSGRTPASAKRWSRGGLARSLKIWSARAGLLLVSLAVGLLIGEFAVRIVVPQNLPTTRSDIWIPKAGIGYEKAPNIETMINAGEGEVQLWTDRKGYRIGPEGVDEEARRILALGDSFLEALAVNYEETTTGRLERLLTAELGYRLRVVNTGVSGYAPNEYLFKAKQELADDKFDLVLVFIFVGNDFNGRRLEWMNPHKPSKVVFRMPRSLGHRELVDAVVFPTYRHLRARSHLMVLVKKRSGLLLARMGMTERLIPPVFLHSEHESPHWEVMKSLCRDIVAEASRHHTPVVFVILPADYQVNERLGMAFAAGSGYDKGEVDLELPNRRLREFFQTAELPYVDTTLALKEAFASGEVIYGGMDRHFNAKGHEVVANRLEPVVVKQLNASQTPYSSPANPPAKPLPPP